MLTDVAPHALHSSSPSNPPVARHPVTQAVADLARPQASKLDLVAARGRLRDALTSYIRSLRASGASPSDVFAYTNSLVRHALAGIAPARLSDEIREAVRRWVLAAYDRAD
jgi:hypothetical protein